MKLINESLEPLWRLMHVGRYLISDEKCGIDPYSWVYLDIIKWKSESFSLPKLHFSLSSFLYFSSLYTFSFSVSLLFYIHTIISSCLLKFITHTTWWQLGEKLHSVRWSSTISGTHQILNTCYFCFSSLYELGSNSHNNSSNIQLKNNCAACRVTHMLYNFMF